LSKALESPLTPEDLARTTEERKTLIIEDDRPTRLLLERILRNRGHHVASCESAEEALEILSADFFPLITLDIQLPGMSGLEFAKKLRLSPTGDWHYILVGTGNSRPEDLREILAAGADDYISKPYHPGLLDIRLTVAESALLGITRRKILEDELRYIAHHDTLTRLLNRNGLTPAVQRAIQAARQGNPGSLMYLDLDNFKIVNDSLGHDTGDDLLLKVSDILQRVSGASDSLIRFGGDEFVLVMPGCPIEEAVVRAEAIRESVEELVYVTRGRTLRAAVSVGLSPINEFSSEGAVIGNADEACYAAKAGGRNRVEVYTEQTAEIARLIADTDWTSRIRAAMQDGSLQLWYQPIMHSSGGTYLAQELLLRYRDPTGEVIRPGAFLKSVQRAHQMERVDRFVIARAFEALAIHPFLKVAINISGQLFVDADYSSFVESMLSDSGIGPERVIFEITEDELIANLSMASGFISRLQALGCRIGLDDFGSGFSSLAYLEKLPIDFIKMDGSFTKDIANNAFHRAVISAIHDVAIALGISTVAEFVETKEEALVLQDLGINYLQGHLFAEPRDAPFTTSELSELAQITEASTPA